jgi:hypothetical protein
MSGFLAALSVLYRLRMALILADPLAVKIECWIARSCVTEEAGLVIIFVFKDFVEHVH